MASSSTEVDSDATISDMSASNVPVDEIPPPVLDVEEEDVPMEQRNKEVKVPDWLTNLAANQAQDWRAFSCKRKNGHIDSTYIHKDYRHKFRSKREVELFIKTNGMTTGLFKGRKLQKKKAAGTNAQDAGEEAAHHPRGLQIVNQGFHPGYSDFGATAGRSRHWTHRDYRPRSGSGFPASRGGRHGRTGHGAGRASYASAVGSESHVDEVTKAALTGTVPPIRHSAANQYTADSHEDQQELMGTGEHPGKEMVCGCCSLKGHATADCSNDVYCYICDGHDHVNHLCPVLKLPKPVANLVGCSVDGLGFHHIAHAPLPRTKDSKTAVVTVVGGVISKEQLVVQLQRIVPVGWRWDPIAQDDNSFIVQFPSMAELQRSMAYGGVDVMENGVATGIRLNFQISQVKEEGYLLPKVWLQVTGIEKPLQEYHVLWAVGTVFGSTQMVDMVTTRKNDFGRILVAVLDPNLVPSKKEVVIGDHRFELGIKMEKIGFDENGDEVEFNFGRDDDGGQGKEGEKSKEKKDDNPAKHDDPMDHNNDFEGTDLGYKSLGGNPNVENMLRDKMEGAIDSAINSLISECTDVIFGEMVDVMVEDVDLEDEFDYPIDGGMETTEEPTAMLPAAGQLLLASGLAAVAPIGSIAAVQPDADTLATSLGGGTEDGDGQSGCSYGDAMTVSGRGDWKKVGEEDGAKGVDGYRNILAATVSTDVGAAANVPGGDMEGTGCHLLDSVSGKGNGLLDFDAEETDFTAKVGASLWDDDTGPTRGSGILKAASAGMGQTNLQVQGLPHGVPADLVAPIAKPAADGLGTAGKTGQDGSPRVVPEVNAKVSGPSLQTSFLAASAISKTRKTSKWASPRLAMINDLDSMKTKKKRAAAWKNLDFSAGN